MKAAPNEVDQIWGNITTNALARHAPNDLSDPTFFPAIQPNFD
jgi:hypothetical protein